MTPDGAPRFGALHPARFHPARLLHRWFFIRYWEGGPHLRIRLLPRPDAGRAATPAALDAAVRRAFADVPRDGHDPEGYPASIGDLAAASVASDPTVDRRLAATVLPPGVHAARYVPETDRYGTGAALASKSSSRPRHRPVPGCRRGTGCRTAAVNPIPYWFSCGPTPTTGAAGPGPPRRRRSPRRCWRSMPPTGSNSWCRAGG
ncbi:lantibiotic dehydratase C-terminal domain-containing protein [Streptomyces sp. NRRL S-237]|uniref:lantibiotic dehydratase C-terminal domain-containing protein n=1 Tax=Streptomyces sp. NRRL S-237 TaxID=1463895 RepID=UPI00099CF35B|nr:lantibiotic dehydratase C-terminal domain-containing protein [Streptomyces sp. NRRL S-237]